MDFLSDPTLFGALVSTLVKLGVPFSEKILRAKREMGKNDSKAAWDLYVEMGTRITTQPLPPEQGDEKTALDSIHSLFQTTRGILIAQGPDCVEFAQVAIVILNEKVRPFTTKWQRKSLAGAFDDAAACDEFRDELESLQEILREYARVLATLAGAESLNDLLSEPRLQQEEANTSKFAANKVKAVAEFSWWKGAQKRTLLKEFNLTEEQFKEIQSTCEYKERVLNLMLENRSAKEFEEWVSRYGGNMPQRFGEIMGLEPEVVSDMVKQVSQAHADIAASRGRKPWRL